MTARAAARPYVAGLFSVVGKDEGGGRAEATLRALVAAFADHAELRQVFDSPTVPPAGKRAILDKLITAAGDVAPEVRRFVLLLADQNQIDILPEVASGFSIRLREARNIVQADVVTAVPLGAGRTAALEAALSRAAGSTVTLTERIDPTIVGGVVARVGSTVYDGSVTRQLERLRQRLLGDA